MTNSISRLKVVNSSFINNRSGNISLNYGASATLTHITILGKGSAIETVPENFGSAGSVNLRNSIISGGLSSDDCVNFKQNIGNLIEDGACSPRLNGDPGLAEPDDSSTHLELLPGSPAIGAADPRFCPDTDQLGRPRAIVGNCDIGAIEAVPVSQAVSDCVVTTTHGLNFRDGPGGKRIGIALPKRQLLSRRRRGRPVGLKWSTKARRGWISADYVTTEGDCELE